MAWPEIAAAVKGLLEEIDGLTVYDFEPDAWPNTDHAVVIPGEPMARRSGHAGMIGVRARVLVRCPGTATEGEAQSRLTDYLWPSGARSIVAAIEADEDLGGLSSPVKYESSSDIRLAEDTQRTWEGFAEFYMDVRP